MFGFLQALPDYALSSAVDGVIVKLSPTHAASASNDFADILEKSRREGNEVYSVKWARSSDLKILAKFCATETEILEDRVEQTTAMKKRNAVLVGVAPRDLCRVIVVARELKIGDLVVVACRALAAALRGKTADEIREALEVPKLTEEEAMVFGTSMNFGE